MASLLRRTCALIAVLGALTFSSVLFAQEDELSVAIRPVDNGVEFTLTNNTSGQISLLRWETPLEPELTQDVFVVSASDGGNQSLYADRAVFSGRVFKRADPEPQDFIKLAAGESMTSFVPLAEYYQLTNDGSHFVSFRGAFRLVPEQRDRSILFDDSSLKSVYARTDSVMVNLTPRPEALYARPAGYSGCTAAQLAQLPGDFDASEQITREAKEALQNLPVDQRAASPRYLQWFGTYSSGRYAQVLDTYVKAEALMGQGAVEFLCDCTEPYYAFIRRTEQFKVNLCTFYWSADRFGSDSRAGTILHEVSHFNEIAGSEDNAYGAVDTTALALSDPGKAVNNADNIEYFAENTPFREISAGVAPPPPQPEPPVGPITFTTLSVGTAVTGSVTADSTIYYQVTGADEIALTSISGDADLIVYSDAAASNQVCSANTATGVDACSVDASSTAYIAVVGYDDAVFSIAANSNSVPLQLGQTQTVSITAGAQQYFTITGANYVQINSLSGDADLYVYSNSARQRDSLTCDSRSFSAASTLDTCEINATGYVSVFGVQDGQYTITSSTTDPRTPTVTTQSLDQGDSGGGQFGAGFAALLVVPLFIRRRTGYLAGRRTGVVQ